MAERLLRFSDDELGAALVDVGGRLAYPRIDVATSVIERVRTKTPAAIPLRRRRLVRRAVLAAMAAVLLLGAAAVAGRLGVPGLRVIFEEKQHAPTNVPVGRNLFLGEPTTLDQARQSVPFDVLTPHGQGLGPAEVYLGSDPPPGRVSLVYPSGPGLPRSKFTRAGLMITEFEGRLDEGYVKKISFEGTRVRSVDVNGDHGLWFSGEPHELLFVDRDGIPFQESNRLAGNTLVWSHEGATLRLECRCSADKALTIARSMR